MGAKSKVTVGKVSDRDSTKRIVGRVNREEPFVFYVETSISHDNHTITHRRTIRVQLDSDGQGGWVFDDGGSSS